MTTNAASMLREAANIVSGARNQTHGSPERSFQLISTLWTAYLGAPVSPVDVAQMMTLLKIARAKCGTPAIDHFVDGAGYQALAGELAIEKP
jgi:hypothetical protein